MSVSIRWEQCCESEGCRRPAHYGVLCAACFMAATPARRAVELDFARVDSLEALWLLPASEAVNRDESSSAGHAVGLETSGTDPLEALWSLPAVGARDA